MNRVALCAIATGKYGRFLPGLLESAERFFCCGHARKFLIYTDDAKATARESIDAVIRPAFHEPWPGPTLHRYHTLLRAHEDMEQCDYVFHCDADMRFVATVGEEILGAGLTAVIHPGYAGKTRENFTYEVRPESTAAIGCNEGTHYFAGGFQGGRANDFLDAMRVMRAGIDIDGAHGLVAVWHDESHWNRYLIDHPPAVTLSPDYCCPETWPRPGRKLLALDKNHAELRSL